ncbi:MAG: carbohydrate porin [Aquificae bacterium]|nr:carbohydrate porin [Aquificota bacterium]
MKIRQIIIHTTAISCISYAQEITEKPFILEHLYHTHKVDLTNTTVYQQIRDFGAFYNTTNIFFSYYLTQKDHFFVSLSIALGNGIVSYTQKLGYSVEPTGANLEDYIENINDTGRKHLTEVWYHKQATKLDLVAGLIDSASFVDENRFANDENVQFLNNAFINNPVLNMPSFNPGLYIRIPYKNIEYKFLFMDNEPTKGNFSIFQVNYTKNDLIIRPYIYKTFGIKKSEGFGISGDYSTKNTGYFFRVGIPFYQESQFYSVGIQKTNIDTKDKIGIALGMLNKDKNAYMSEIYYNKEISSHIVLTLDFQYTKENEEDFIVGSRVYLSY